MGKEIGNFFGQGLTRPAVVSADGVQFFDTPDQQLNAATKDVAKTPLAVNAPAAGNAALGVGQGDVFDENATPAPKMAKPSFLQATNDANGMPLAQPQGLTKLGTLMNVLKGAAMGGLAGQAAAEQSVIASGGHRSAGFGTGFQAGLNEPIHEAQRAYESRVIPMQLQHAQEAMQPIQTPWGKMTMGRAQQMAQINNQVAQARWHNAQADLNSFKETPADKKVSDYVDPEGVQHVVFQRHDNSTYDVKLGKAAMTPDKQETPHTVATGKGVYQWNPATKKFDIYVGPPNRAEAGAPAAPQMPGVGGQDLLDSLSPSDKALIKSIINYQADPRVAIPARSGGGRGAESERKRIMGLVYQIDPTYDMSQYGSRAAMRKDMTSGKTAANIRSLNTAINHLNTLADAATKLDNSSFRSWNWVANHAEQQTGNPNLDRFNTAANAIESEMANVFKGTGATDQEIKSWRENLSPNMSPDQFKGVIDQLIELMAGRMGSISGQIQGAMGKPKDFALLNDKSRSILKKIGGDKLLEADGLDTPEMPTPQQAAPVPNAAPAPSKPTNPKKPKNPYR